MRLLIPRDYKRLLIDRIGLCDTDSATRLVFYSVITVRHLPGGLLPEKAQLTQRLMDFFPVNGQAYDDFTKLFYELASGVVHRVSQNVGLYAKCLFCFWPHLKTNVSPFSNVPRWISSTREKSKQWHVQ